MKKIISLALLTLMFLLLSSDVFAQVGSGGSGSVGSGGSGEPTPTVRLDNPLKADSVQSLLANIVDLAIKLGAIVAVLMFIWIGFKFVMAQGSETKIKEAKDWFTYAVIGTALLISSKVILEVIKNTLIESGLVNQNLF